MVTSDHYFLRKNNASHCLVGTFHQRALQATNSHSTAQSQFSIRYSIIADNCGHHSKMSPFSVFHRQQCCRTVHSAKVWWKFSHRSCVEYNCTSESLPLPRTDKLSLTALILSNNWPLSKQLQMSIWCPDFQHRVTNQLFTASILFWIPLFHTFTFCQKIFPIFLQHY